MSEHDPYASMHATTIITVRKDGKVVMAGDGQVRATCGQGFTSRDACLEGVAFVRTVAPLAETRDDEFPTANEGQPGVFIDRSLP